MLDTPSPQRTPLSELGEFGLIDRLTAAIELKAPSTRKGVGDDAAVLDFGDSEVLISKDLLVEGIHFDLGYVPLKHLGYKAAVVNFSDIYAMNGTPSQLLVGMAVSSRFPVEALEEIYAGLLLACSRYGVDLVGGDTTSSQSGLVLSVTAVGHVAKGKSVQRDGAQAGDLLVVTGDLGAAYMGLQVLEREKAAYQANPNLQPELQGHEYVLERQLKPEARKDISALLAELGVIPTSMMDISDGLSSEILHLGTQSGVGCTIYEDKIPMDPQMMHLAEEFGINPITAVLNGGEDYELLFTIPIADFDKIKGNPSLTPIGHMTADKVFQMVTNSGQAVALEAQGWKAFSADK
ncbi:MAG: thiamine-phosphate kinase [Bacteroidetes bacterium]|jgi:thiamine-monophosphate kinase|nr:MAG: thiamine-monophosphate kinase [Cryomorphaceae bacterium BACL23 MAG-120924-bin60]MBL6626912.1 thiamine-phosphate kinase [Cryomorphaceae bacterium]MDA0363276.1 thiamine-phosphate kinase [Bacteroidota bacterium]MDP5067859.1 thiamine-phosphate kinase [Schleiferiaceae bacterium]NDA27267.1 thiamine-phosphate kinase [Flavobacteriia bacterium]